MSRAAPAGHGCSCAGPAGPSCCRCALWKSLLRIDQKGLTTMAVRGIGDWAPKCARAAELWARTSVCSPFVADGGYRQSDGRGRRPVGYVYTGCVRDGRDAARATAWGCVMAPHDAAASNMCALQLAMTSTWISARRYICGGALCHSWGVVVASRAAPEPGLPS